MRMHSEEGAYAGKSGENGEAVSLGVPEVPDLSISQKYRELKSKLKYLIYEHRCFESELSTAQNRLIELSQDKTVLLDQLLQYEPVSGDEDDITNYSGSEDEAMDKPAPKQQHGEGSGRNSLSIKPSSVRSSRSPVATTSSHPPSKPSSLTKQGIAKATAIINSVSNNITTKVAKAGTKRQAKQVVKSAGIAGTAVKISKTVSQVRYNAVVQDEPAAANNTALGTKQKLVVSFPINSIATESGAATTTTTTTTLLTPSTPHFTPLTLSTTSTTVTSNKTIRPVPALTKAKPSPSSLIVSSMGSVHVTTLSSATTMPPLIPDTGKTARKNSSTSSSSSSGSSSDSDSAESGSDLSSESEDEAMETEDAASAGRGGPVQIVSSVKNSSDLPRPKAIMSPVKIAPPMLVRGGGVPTPPPIVVSPQPAWNQSQVANATAEVVSPLPGTEVGVFIPIASPLSSPVLPFSSLNNPGATSSAFQVFSPNRITSTPSSPQVTSITLPPPLAPTSSSHVHITKTDTAKANSRPNSAGHSNSK